MITLDIFCDWFTGRWNNSRQAYDNPKGTSYVLARHERISDREFHCVYNHHRQKTPYRDFTLNVSVLDNEVILKDRQLELVYQLRGGVYTCDFDEVIDGKRYLFQAVLGDGFYRLNDQCFQQGKLVRGLPAGEFYDFRKAD